MSNPDLKLISEQIASLREDFKAGFTELRKDDALLSAQMNGLNERLIKVEAWKESQDKAFPKLQTTVEALQTKVTLWSGALLVLVPLISFLANKYAG